MADLSSLIKNDLVNALNDHDINRVLQCFDDNAVINLTVPPPGFSNTVKGKSEIRRYYEALIPGIHVQMGNVKSSGDKVEWTAHIVSTLLKNSGLDGADIHGTGTIKNNKIVSWSPVYPQTLAQGVRQGTQTQGPRPNR